MNEFVPASQLYDVESRTPIAHPAHQATDEEVHRALEDREIRADGGHSSSGTDHCNFWNVPFPQEQLLVPIGRILPDKSTFAAYTDPQRSQTATTRLRSAILFTQIINTVSSSFSYFPFCFGRSLQTDTDREDGGSR